MLFLSWAHSRVGEGDCVVHWVYTITCNCLDKHHNCTIFFQSKDTDRDGRDFTSETSTVTETTNPHHGYEENGNLIFLFSFISFYPNFLSAFKKNYLRFNYSFQDCCQTSDFWDKSKVHAYSTVNKHNLSLIAFRCQPSCTTTHCIHDVGEKMLPSVEIGLKI